MLEIYLLLQVGGLIGVLPTVGLILLTAFLGALLLRWQGLHTLATIQAALERHELPARSLLEGVILLLTGTLLLTPGFFTDSIGFALLVPAWRRQLAGRLLDLLSRRAANHDGSENVVIEGEFREEKPENRSKYRLDRD